MPVPEDRDSGQVISRHKEWQSQRLGPTAILPNAKGRHLKLEQNRNIFFYRELGNFCL